ncbi:hypothetical protein [Companilactobacillus tucceti]|uniref:hypothetical protein n=1 Tax=Companilactobacillus tucceti TaxID=238012 RepID=UPI00070BFCFA|nr:hypothetical protein [Companilactobacillus tucceti]
MNIIITLINGETIEIKPDTYIKTSKALSSRFSDEGDTYYLEQIFEGYFKDGKQYNSIDEVAKIEGLLGTSDWFTIGKDNSRSIKTSSILSITRE